jgi:hypothetical protein
MGDDVLCPVLDFAGFNIAAVIQVYTDVAAAKFESDSVVFTAFDGGWRGLTCRHWNSWRWRRE